MISRDRLRDISKKTSLHLYQQEKDYLIKLFLFNYFRKYDSAIFKGGTCVTSSRRLKTSGFQFVHRVNVPLLGTPAPSMCKEAYEVQHSRAVVHAVTDCFRHGLIGHTPNHLLFCRLSSRTNDIPFGRVGSTLHPVFSGPTPACS